MTDNMFDSLSAEEKRVLCDFGADFLKCAVDELTKVLVNSLFSSPVFQSSLEVSDNV